MRSDIAALLDEISSRTGGGQSNDATGRGLVVHGNVQTIVLANTISVDTLHVAPGFSADDETPQSETT